MLNYLKKFTVDIFPSVAATVIGAYIVNHYIVSKPATDAPAAAVSTADSNGKTKATKDANPDGTTAVSNLPAAGVKAKGISEKAIMEKNAAEQRPAVAEKAQEKTDAKADAAKAKADAAKAEAAKAETAKAETAKAETAKAETAKADAKTDTRHDAKSAETATPREKEKIRVVLPSPIQPAASSAQPSASTPAPAAAAPAPVAPAETAAAPAQEERRDANDLARAAIERLRSNGEGSARAPEVARIPDAPKETSRAETPKAEPPKAESPRVAAAPALRPLPPPVMISAPPTAGEPYGQAAPQRPPYAANVEDPRRPTPPAEIPLSRPLDLRAEAAEPSVRQRTEAAAEEVLSTAKSLFHAVLPK
jgi:hypothetical protein